ncbi:MAG: DUF6311 domain-containing protein [Rhizomicrobium sp.]
MSLMVGETGRAAADGTGLRRTLAWRNWNILFFALAVAVGALDVWLLVGWREIDPLNLSWLSGDSATYQTGWEFLRYEKHWLFPPTWVTGLDYPTGISASYLDIIPLVGVPLRLISVLLPGHFQYLGPYAVACFGLQAWFGFKLSSLFADGDGIVALLGGALFLVSPVLTKELYGHFALLSQWIVVASIYYYFRISAERPLRSNLLPFVVICAIAAAVQPYFALMANLIAAAGIARTFGLCRTKLVARIAWALMPVSATALSLFVFGFIVPGKTEFAGKGYTNWSMNLLAPINPQTPWAPLFKAFPVVHGWTLAGYDYLGLGVLLLLFVLLARTPAAVRKLWSEPIWPLTVISIVCTLLALSVQVAFGTHVLFTIPLPKFAFNLLAAFRGSGRLFWPAYYLLSLAGIAGLMTTVRSPAARRALLAVALTLQYFDGLPIRDGVAASAQAYHPDRLVSTVWTALSRNYHHLVILPAFQCGARTPAGLDVWPQFAGLAARGGMTLNSVYASRMRPQTLRLDCVTIPAQVMREGLDARTAYILSDGLVADLGNRPHDCRRVDGFNLCTRTRFRRS